VTQPVRTRVTAESDSPLPRQWLSLSSTVCSHVPFFCTRQPTMCSCMCCTTYICAHRHTGDVAGCAVDLLDKPWSTLDVRRSYQPIRDKQLLYLGVCVKTAFFRTRSVQIPFTLSTMQPDPRLVGWSSCQNKKDGEPARVKVKVKVRAFVRHRPDHLPNHWWENKSLTDAHSSHRHTLPHRSLSSPHRSHPHLLKTKLDSKYVIFRNTRYLVQLEL
jgi:hypothetical protein